MPGKDRNAREWTKIYYPNKMSVEDFIKAITDPATNKAFIENMKHLKVTPKHAEEWIETYAAWMEMEKESR